MYTHDEYFYGWLLYLAGVALMMGCGWYLTSDIRIRPLKILLRIAAAAFFLVPWYASSDLDYLAPAWLIASFEGVLGGETSFWRAGAPLLSGVALSVFIALVIMIGLHYFRKSKDPMDVAE